MTKRWDVRKRTIYRTSLKLSFVLVFLIGCDDSRNNDDNPYHQKPIPWPSLADSPWPIFQHDAQGTGRSQYEGPKVGQLFFIYEDSFWLNSSPVIGENNVKYLASSADTCYLYALDDSGDVLWKCYLNSINNYYSEIVATPTIGSNGLIYIPSAKIGDERLHAISTDGEEIWSLPMHLNTSIALDMEGNLYCIEDNQNTLISLTADGDLRWQLSTDDGFQSQYNPIVFSTNGQTLFATGRDSIYAISTDGNILWSYWTGRWYEYIVVDNDDNLYFNNVGDSSITSLNYVGEVNWKVHWENLGVTSISPSNAPTLTVDGNLIYAGRNDEGDLLVAITINGDLLWTLPVSRIGPHLISDKIGNIYIGSDQFMCISSTGSILWTSDFPENVPGSDFSPSIGINNECYLGIPNSRYTKLIGYN